MGEINEKGYLKRIPKLLFGFIIILKNLNVFRNSNCIYCINVDMLILASILRIRYKVNLYYEVGDILNTFLGNTISNNVLRFLERFLLKNTKLLILTSPAFYQKFYKKIQKTQCPWMLLENKLISIEKPKINIKYEKSKKIKIVYHGVLRCPLSIKILTTVAAEFKEKCELHIHGFPLWVNKKLLNSYSSKNKNIFWHGEFKYPDDLKAILSDADLLWLIDLSENKSNAKWLLPNRLYDGICYRVPMLALSDTETGNYIKKYDIGWCFGENVFMEFRNLVSFISFKEIFVKKKIIDNIPFCYASSLKQHKRLYELM
jgi:succinoglycan biosynthesis protein ExoL